MNQFSRPTTEDEEQFGRIEERPLLEGRFRGLLTVFWTRGSSPDLLDWAEDPHGRILMGQFGQLPHTRKIPQRLGDQDKDFSPPAYSARSLVILGLSCII